MYRKRIERKYQSKSSSTKERSCNIKSGKIEDISALNGDAEKLRSDTRALKTDSETKYKKGKW